MWNVCLKESEPFCNHEQQMLYTSCSQTQHNTFPPNAADWNRVGADREVEEEANRTAASPEGAAGCHEPHQQVLQLLSITHFSIHAM